MFKLLSEGNFKMRGRVVSFVAVFGFIGIALFVLQPLQLAAANKSANSQKRPIRNPKFDPTADRADLFDAMTAGQVGIKVIMADSKSGNVIIENKTDKPLTIKFPEAVVAVPINAQVNQFGNGLQGNGLQGGLAAQGAGNGGQAQQAAGAVVGQGLQGLQGPFQGNLQGQNPGQNQGGPIPNFFSIPAENSISLPLTSVCLQYGKREPDPKSKYTLVEVATYSSDPVLYQLLKLINESGTELKAVQAAAWHLTDKIPFDRLALESDIPIGTAIQIPEFTRQQITAAQDLVARAKQKADEQKLDSNGASLPETVLTKTNRVKTN